LVDQRPRTAPVRIDALVEKDSSLVLHSRSIHAGTKARCHRTTTRRFLLHHAHRSDCTRHHAMIARSTTTIRCLASSLRLRDPTI
jgi:hypothetical protein